MLIPFSFPPSCRDIDKTQEEEEEKKEKPTMTTAATIHLVRHAQGFHNLSEENESLHDPDLTPLGEQQCADLRASFPSHDKLVRLVASPLRRTIYTAELSFGRPSLHPIVLLDLLQEVSASPCDTGSSKAELAAEFGDKVDLGSVRDAWTEKGPGSVFEPSLEALTARAKLARKALKKLLDEAGGGDVAVVTHGGFLHFLTDDWEDVPSNKGKKKNGKKKAPHSPPFLAFFQKILFFLFSSLLAASTFWVHLWFSCCLRNLSIMLRSFEVIFSDQDYSDGVDKLHVPVVPLRRGSR